MRGRLPSWAWFVAGVVFFAALFPLTSYLTESSGRGWREEREHTLAQPAADRRDAQAREDERDKQATEEARATYGALSTEGRRDKLNEYCLSNPCDDSSFTVTMILSAAKTDEERKTLEGVITAAVGRQKSRLRAGTCREDARQMIARMRSCGVAKVDDLSPENLCTAHDEDFLHSAASGSCADLRAFRLTIGFN